MNFVDATFLTNGPITKEANNREDEKGNEGQNGKETRKQAQQVKATRLMASRPMKIKRVKERINGLRKAKE